jgi:hypothetical protein
MEEQDRAALQAAVELLHNCGATFLRADRVRVTSGSITIQRDVAVFELRGPGRPAPIAYAWIDSTAGEPDRARHQVVLHGGVVKSPEHAVAGFYLAHSRVDTGDTPTDEVVKPYPEY